MEKLANRVAEKVAQNEGLGEERRRVIAYGLGALFQVVVILVVSIAFGLLYHCLIESLIVFAAVGVLKSSVGGAHARTIGSCTVISLVSIFLMALISRYAIPAIPAYRPAYLAFALLVTGFAGWFAYRVAPVASPNKPISRPEKRARLRRRCFVTLALYCLISCALIILGDRYPRGINASFSLCLATLWQTLMLTEAAGKFLSSLNSPAALR